MGSDHIKELLLVLLDVIIELQFCKLCVCGGESLFSKDPHCGICRWKDMIGGLL